MLTCPCPPATPGVGGAGLAAELPAAALGPRPRPLHPPGSGSSNEHPGRWGGGARRPAPSTQPGRPRRLVCPQASCGWCSSHPPPCAPGTQVTCWRGSSQTRPCPAPATAPGACGRDPSSKVSVRPSALPLGSGPGRGFRPQLRPTGHLALLMLGGGGGRRKRDSWFSARVGTAPPALRQGRLPATLSRDSRGRAQDALTRGTGALQPRSSRARCEMRTGHRGKRARATEAQSPEPPRPRPPDRPPELGPLPLRPARLALRLASTVHLHLLLHFVICSFKTGWPPWALGP